MVRSLGGSRIKKKTIWRKKSFSFLFTYVQHHYVISGCYPLNQELAFTSRGTNWNSLSSKPPSWQQTDNHSYQKGRPFLVHIDLECVLMVSHKRFCWKHSDFYISCFSPHCEAALNALSLWVGTAAPQSPAFLSTVPNHSLVHWLFIFLPSLDAADRFDQWDWMSLKLIYWSKNKLVRRNHLLPHGLSGSCILRPASGACWGAEGK